MNNFKLIFFLLSLLILIGCKKENGCYIEKGKIVSREILLSDFQTIDQNIKANFILSAASEQLVVIEGSKSIVDLIEKESYVENGIWHLGFESCVQDYTPLTIYISLPNYVAFINNGIGDVNSNSTLNTGDDFSVLVGGSGDLNLDLNSLQNVSIELNGTGNLILSGQAINEVISVSGTGVVDAFGLMTQNCSVEIKGNGNCLVNVSDSLNVDIVGNGTVYYKGYPTLIQSISGAGNVIDAN